MSALNPGSRDWHLELGERRGAGQGIPETRFTRPVLGRVTWGDLHLRSLIGAGGIVSSEMGSPISLGSQEVSIVSPRAPAMDSHGTYLQLEAVAPEFEAS